MRYISLKNLKKYVISRALPLFLAALMVLPSAPLTGISAGEDAGKELTQNSNSLVYDYDTLKLTVDGEQTKELSIFSYEKIEVGSVGITENATYQWQIKHPEKNNLWVDIYDAKSDSIGVSVALINNMLAEDGTAKIRLRAYTEDYAYLSNTLTVSVKDEQSSEPTLSVDKITFPHAMAGETSETPEFVTVTIEYEKYEYHYDSTLGKYKLDYMGPAFSSYIATLRYGSPLISDSTGITVPDIVGFSPVLVAADGITLTGNKAFLNIPSVTENVTFTIKYMPEKVDYEVRYRFQNVYDDSYVTDTSINDASMGITNGIYYGKGYTGLPPYIEVDGSGNLIENDEKIGVYAEFDGFAPLYYQPDTIASDGSTIFEVFYERTYYLMEFDCAGGYGAHTLYVRHGTYIYVPNPIRTGYVFMGWDKLDAEGNGDGIADELPSNMPVGNTSYVALWSTTQTTYTVVYWIKNEDGTKTYIGSRPVTETSAKKVSGSNDLSATLNLCGFEEHTHTSCTFLCGKTEHSHGAGCCIVTPHIHGADCCDIDKHSHGDDCCSITPHTHSGDCCSVTPHPHSTSCYTQGGNNGIRIDSSRVTSSSTITALNNITPAANGIVSYNNYYIKIGTYWYRVRGLSNSNWNTATIETCGKTSHTHGDGNCVYCSEFVHTHGDGNCDTIECGNQTEHTHGNGDCNNAKCSLTAHTHGDGNCVYCSLSLTEHTHNEKCYSCGKVAHTHADKCKFANAEQVVFIEADKDKIVEGDGSTVVNVTYAYQLYTLRFYYARSTGSGTNTVYSVVGGTTYPFGTYTSVQDETWPVSELLGLVTEWGSVTKLPTINDDYSDRYNTGSVTYGSYTYYYLEFTAPYGAVLENKWPIGIFNSVKISETHSQCPNYDEAYFSAWNGEFKVKYTQDHASRNDKNETIKGLYMYLDENVIYAPQFESEYTAYVNSAGKETRLVNFLGFWDNGYENSWSIPRLYRYHLMVESLDDTYDRIYNGKKYKTYKYFNTYDDTKILDDPTYENQTRTEIAGLDFDGLEDQKINTDTSDNIMDEVNLYFYYNRQTSDFKLYNYNSDLRIEHSISYGTPLSSFNISAETMQKDYYPEGIEPGAYVFGGWYTTPDYLAGTEVTWSTLTMPDGPLTLYAKWTPVVRNITFHLLYTDIAEDNPWYPPGVSDEDKASYYPIKVPHGDLLGTAYSHTPTRDGDYQFIGWFYFDENGKKKFAPDSMKVTRDLVLFAEWHSSIVTTYDIEYQAYKYVDGGSGDILLNDEIASPFNDYSTAGKTVTFNAKGGKALYTNYQKGWFPNSSSHSILMNSDSTQNTHTFKYYNKDYINYKVMYINRITGDILGETEAIPTENAIVTVKFKPFAGYIPEEYYIEKSIAYDPTDYTQHPNHVLDENIIYFYYVPDTEHALHRFEHYTETLVDSDYTLYSADQGPHKIGENKKATVETITGFELVKIEILTYTLDGGNWIEDKEEIKVTDENRAYYIAKGIEREVTLGGLGIKFYYDRIEYDYTIQYVEDVDNANVLYTTTAKANYGTTVSHTAPATYLNTGDAGDDGLMYIYRDGIDSTAEKRTAEKVITDDASKNVLTFVYAKKRIMVEYHIVCDIESLKSFNSISIANETVASATELMGCIASIGSGFEFLGWFYDEECKNPVPNSWVTVNGSDIKLLAQEIVEGADGKEHFYAKFEPISGSLKIIKDVANPDADTAKQNFLFHIKGKNSRNSFVDTVVSINGEGWLIIEDLPIGDYDITELTGWSWEYTAAVSSYTATIEADTQSTTTFTNTDNNSNWLNGEASNENVFN